MTYHRRAIEIGRALGLSDEELMAGLFPRAHAAMVDFDQSMARVNAATHDAVVAMDNLMAEAQQRKPDRRNGPHPKRRWWPR